MFAQPGFAEPEYRARPDDRIFFAALPDAGAKAEIARRVSRVCGDRMTANGFDAARLHVSLCFLATDADLSPAIAEGRIEPPRRSACGRSPSRSIA